MEIFYPGGLFGLIPAPVGHGFHRNQRLLLEVISSLVYKLHQIHGYLGATNWIYVHQLVAIERGPHVVEPRNIEKLQQLNTFFQETQGK